VGSSSRCSNQDRPAGMCRGTVRPMSIFRDECDERQTRVGRMIDEFRTAQSRRLAKATSVKGNNRAVELQHDAYAQATVAASTATATTTD
jgi:hypothetical protein